MLSKLALVKVEADTFSRQQLSQSVLAPALFILQYWAPADKERTF